MHFRNARTDTVKRESNNFSMPARLKPTIAQANRSIGQPEKWSADWQKIADEQTAKAFELYIARLKQNPPLRP